LVAPGVASGVASRAAAQRLHERRPHGGKVVLRSLKIYPVEGVNPVAIHLASKLIYVGADFADVPEQAGKLRLLDWWAAGLAWQGCFEEHFADVAAERKASPFGGGVERRAFGFGQPNRDAAASLPSLAPSAQTISSMPLNFGDATGACPLAKRAV
jgi:hypothetical protein